MNSRQIDISDQAMAAEAFIAPREFNFAELLDLSVIQPGDTVNIGGGSDLDQFESAFVQAKLPSRYQDSLKRWQARPKLHDELRQKGFNGRLTDVKAIVLDEPYLQLTKFSRNFIGMVDAESRTIGFRLLANLSSTGRGNIGSIDSRVWVYQRLVGGALNMYGEYGRKIEKPAKSQKSVEEAIEEAKRTGTLVLMWAISNPIPTPFGPSKR